MPTRDDTGRWIKGESGNPNGRPKVPTFATLLARIKERGVTEFQHPDWGVLEPEELAAAQLFSAMANGEPWAIQDFLNRLLGKAAQSVDVRSESDGRIIVEWQPLTESLTAPTQDKPSYTDAASDSAPSAPGGAGAKPTA